VDDLPGIQTGGLLGKLMIFFDGPPPADDRDGDQPGQRLADGAAGGTRCGRALT
jgi:hypothetical protein